jgi:hypothetical protein
MLTLLSRSRLSGDTTRRTSSSSAQVSRTVVEMPERLL